MTTIIQIFAKKCVSSQQTKLQYFLGIQLSIKTLYYPTDAQIYNS